MSRTYPESAGNRFLAGSNARGLPTDLTAADVAATPAQARALLQWGRQAVSIANTIQAATNIDGVNTNNWAAGLFFYPQGFHTSLTLNAAMLEVFSRNENYGDAAPTSPIMRLTDITDGRQWWKEGANNWRIISESPIFTVGSSFPASPVLGSIHYFDVAVASGLVWQDEGGNALTAAAKGDLAKWNGTAWVHSANISGLTSTATQFWFRRSATAPATPTPAVSNGAVTITGWTKGSAPSGSLPLYGIMVLVLDNDTTQTSAPFLFPDTRTNFFRQATQPVAVHAGDVWEKTNAANAVELYMAHEQSGSLVWSKVAHNTQLSVGNSADLLPASPNLDDIFFCTGAFTTNNRGNGNYPFAHGTYYRYTAAQGDTPAGWEVVGATGVLPGRPLDKSDVVSSGGTTGQVAVVSGSGFVWADQPPRVSVGDSLPALPRSGDLLYVSSNFTDSGTTYTAGSIYRYGSVNWTRVATVAAGGGGGGAGIGGRSYWARKVLEVSGMANREVVTGHDSDVTPARLLYGEKTDCSTGTTGFQYYTLYNEAAVTPIEGGDLQAGPFATNFEGVASFTRDVESDRYPTAIVRTTHVISGQSNIVSVRAVPLPAIIYGITDTTKADLVAFNSMVNLARDVANGGKIGLKIELALALHSSEANRNTFIRKVQAGQTIGNTEAPAASLSYSLALTNTAVSFIQWTRASAGAGTGGFSIVSAKPAAPATNAIIFVSTAFTSANGALGNSYAFKARTFYRYDGSVWREVVEVPEEADGITLSGGPVAKLGYKFSSLSIYGAAGNTDFSDATGRRGDLIHVAPANNPILVNTDGSFQWVDDDATAQHLELRNLNIEDGETIIALCRSQRAADATYPTIAAVSKNNTFTDSVYAHYNSAGLRISANASGWGNSPYAFLNTSTLYTARPYMWFTMAITRTGYNISVNFVAHSDAASSAVVTKTKTSYWSESDAGDLYIAYGNREPIGGNASWDGKIGDIIIAARSTGAAALTDVQLKALEAADIYEGITMPRLYETIREARLEAQNAANLTSGILPPARLASGAAEGKGLLVNSSGALAYTTLDLSNINDSANRFAVYLWSHIKAQAQTIPAGSIVSYGNRIYVVRRQIQASFTDLRSKNPDDIGTTTDDQNAGVNRLVAEFFEPQHLPDTYHAVHGNERVVIFGRRNNGNYVEEEIALCLNVNNDKMIHAVQMRENGLFDWLAATNNAVGIDLFNSATYNRYPVITTSGSGSAERPEVAANMVPKGAIKAENTAAAGNVLGLNAGATALRWVVANTSAFQGATTWYRRGTSKPATPATPTPNAQGAYSLSNWTRNASPPGTGPVWKLEAALFLDGSTYSVILSDVSALPAVPDFSDASLGASLQLTNSIFSEPELYLSGALTGLKDAFGNAGDLTNQGGITINTNGSAQFAGHDVAQSLVRSANISLAVGERIVLITKSQRGADTTHPYYFSVIDATQTAFVSLYFDNTQISWWDGNSGAAGEIDSVALEAATSQNWLVCEIKRTAEGAAGYRFRYAIHNTSGVQSAVIQKQSSTDAFGADPDNLRLAIGGRVVANTDSAWDNWISDVFIAKVSRDLTDSELKTLESDSLWEKSPAHILREQHGGTSAETFHGFFEGSGLRAWLGNLPLARQIESIPDKTPYRATLTYTLNGASQANRPVVVMRDGGNFRAIDFGNRITLWATENGNWADWSTPASGSATAASRLADVTSYTTLYAAAGNGEGFPQTEGGLCARVLVGGVVFYLYVSGSQWWIKSGDEDWTQTNPGGFMVSHPGEFASVANSNDYWRILSATSPDGPAAWGEIGSRPYAILYVSPGGNQEFLNVYRNGLIQSSFRILTGRLGNWAIAPMVAENLPATEALSLNVSDEIFIAQNDVARKMSIKTLEDHINVAGLGEHTFTNYNLWRAPGAAVAGDVFAGFTAVSGQTGNRWTISIYPRTTADEQVITAIMRPGFQFRFFQTATPDNYIEGWVGGIVTAWNGTFIQVWLTDTADSHWTHNNLAPAMPQKGGTALPITIRCRGNGLRQGHIEQSVGNEFGGKMHIPSVAAVEARFEEYEAKHNRKILIYEDTTTGDVDPYNNKDLALVPTDMGGNGTKRWRTLDFRKLLIIWQPQGGGYNYFSKEVEVEDLQTGINGNEIIIGGIVYSSGADAGKGVFMQISFDISSGAANGNTYEVTRFNAAKYPTDPDSVGPGANFPFNRLRIYGIGKADGAQH